MPRTAKYNRDDAVDNAVRLFWKRGYAAASMKQVEQALDMRPGSLYATFGSKDGLFAEALDRYGHQMLMLLDERVERFRSPLLGLQGYLRFVAEQSLAPDSPSRACLMTKTLLEMTDEEPQLQRRVNALLAAMEQRLIQLLEDGVQCGELRSGTDCPRLARFVQTQLLGLRTFAQRNVPAGQVTDLVEDIIAVLDHYRPMA